MDQHPSPIAPLSRELGDSGTKEIRPPAERNLTMLSEGKLEELEKVAGAVAPYSRWMRYSALHGQPDENGCEVGDEVNGHVATPESYELAAYIATFDPPTVLALISELRALRAERDEAPLAASAPQTPLGVIIEWFRDLPPQAREGFSLENLHTLSKRITALRAQAPGDQVQCLARKSSGPDPQDCDWPHCGCDPKAERVLEALVEEGWQPPPRAQAPAPVGGEVVEALRDALKPFANFAADNTEADPFDPGSGIWAGNRCDRERINVWFGPTDFRKALAALSPDPTEGGTDE